MTDNLIKKEKKIKENNINIDNDIFKWYLVLVSSKKIDLIKKKLISIIKSHNLSNIIKSIKIPAKSKLIQNDNKNVKIKKISYKGYLLLKIKVIKKENIFQIPNEVFLILKTLNINFLKLGSFQPRPLKQEEVNNLIENNNKVVFKKNKQIKKDFNCGDKVKILFNDITISGIIKKIINKYFFISAIFFSKEVLFKVTINFLIPFNK